MKRTRRRRRGGKGERKKERKLGRESRSISRKRKEERKKERSRRYTEPKEDRTVGEKESRTEEEIVFFCSRMQHRQLLGPREDAEERAAEMPMTTRLLQRHRELLFLLGTCVHACARFRSRHKGEGLQSAKEERKEVYQEIKTERERDKRDRIHPHVQHLDQLRTGDPRLRERERKRRTHTPDRESDSKDRLTR